MNLTYVVVTHNRREHLARCLDSLLARDDVNCACLVVDNASTDGTAAFVEHRFHGVRLLRSETNLGVSGGRNRGIEAAESDLCLAIDDDAELRTPHAARWAIERFKADQRLACAALRIVLAGQSREDHKAIPRRDKRELAGEYECTYFCGAGFVIRRAAFLQCGPFWPALNYGSQEIDLGYRLLDHGWHLIHTDAIEIVHHESPAARPPGQWVFHNARDRVWVAARNLPWPQVASTALLWWGETALAGLRRGEPCAFVRGALAGLSGLPEALRTRRTIGRAARRKLAEHSGRLWY